MPIVIAQLVSSKSSDPTIASGLLMASCDIIWKGILPHKALFIKFLNTGGFDAVLDFMDTGHVWYQPVVLSLLCDMLQIPETHPFLHNWQSGVSGMSSAEKLLEIWREQEDNLGISCKGALVNLTRPLAGTGKRAKWISQVTGPSHALLSYVWFLESDASNPL